jgi:hypothetical protein
MPLIVEPGIRPALAVALVEEELLMPPVLPREGAIRAGLSAPMQGADGTVPGDVTAGVDPIGSAVPLLPSCIAPRGLLTLATADASRDDEAPIVAAEQATETPESPDVDTPDIGDNPDRAESPPPSKFKLLLDDPAGHGEAMDSVPTPSGDVIPVPGAPPIRLVCAKPGLAPSRNSPAVSDSNNKVVRETLEPSCHTLNNALSPSDIALPSLRDLIDDRTNRHA